MNREVFSDYFVCLCREVFLISYAWYPLVCDPADRLMKIIISPAKKMNTNTDDLAVRDLPVFLDKAEVLKNWLRDLSFEEQQKLWSCNEKIAQQNHERFLRMDLRKNLTPALLSFDGIQFQYMAPAVFEDRELDYVQEHLRILSGFYGVLKPMDGVVPYRLEMQAKAKIGSARNLYDFWGNSLYCEVMDESRLVINLASKEYSRSVEKYLQPGDRFITCVFGELSDGKIVQKGVYAKMARGDMVRFLAEIHAGEPEKLKDFDRCGYHFDAGRSSESEYFFVREQVPGK